MSATLLARLPAEELREIEDHHIADAIKKQENVGMQRVSLMVNSAAPTFHVDFLENLEGVTVTGGIKVSFRTKDWRHRLRAAEA